MENTIDTLQIRISKAREELSQESRQAIDAVNWKLIILGMGDKFSPDQLETLQTETELLLCGLTSTVDFPKELETRMRIPRNEVSLLLNEMDKLIFKKMQAELEKKINEGDENMNITSSSKSFTPSSNFTNASRNTQETIAQSNWKGRLYDIGKKYNLPIDQIGEIDIVTDRFLSGRISSREYEEGIRVSMSDTPEKVGLIIKDINEKIIIPKREAGIINNEELIIKNKRGDTGIPLPPYKIINNEELRIKNDNDKIPVPPYKVINNEELIINNANTINTREEDVDQNKTQEDMYREHGIDIITDNYIHRNDGVKVAPITKEQQDAFKSNIIESKLSGKTVSQTTMTDYSLPVTSKIQESKIQGAPLSKPHDPYHEEI